MAAAGPSGAPGSAGPAARPATASGPAARRGPAPSPRWWCRPPRCPASRRPAGRRIPRRSPGPRRRPAPGPGPGGAVRSLAPLPRRPARPRPRPRRRPGVHRAAGEHAHPRREGHRRLAAQHVDLHAGRAAQHHRGRVAQQHDRGRVREDIGRGWPSPPGTSFADWLSSSAVRASAHRARSPDLGDELDLDGGVERQHGHRRRRCGRAVRPRPKHLDQQLAGAVDDLRPGR